MTDPSPDSRKILVVEDEEHIAEGLRLNLTLQGYEVAVAVTGPAALTRWRDFQPDLIILDVMLPGLDGISVLQEIRASDERLPILILSAKSAVEDRLAGLTHGVDDYMVKPFVLDELLLRVARLLTRGVWSRDREEGGPEGEADQRQSDRRLAFGPNRVNLETGEATGVDGTFRLTAQELKLMAIFAENQGKPLPRNLLLEAGWGYSRFTTTRTVDNFIVRLRKYFEPYPKQPRYFISIRSKGYQFNPDGAE